MKEFDLIDVTWDRREYDKLRYEKYRDIIFEYMGGSCVLCRSTNSLEIDHIDPAEKSFSVLARWNKGLEALKPELAKCQLLCGACHKQKTIEGQSVAHGGGTSGKRNCPCVDCKRKKAEYNRNYQLRRPPRRRSNR